MRLFRCQFKSEPRPLIHYRLRVQVLEIHLVDEAGTEGDVRGIDIFQVKEGLICEKFSYVMG
jgi:hypothetical protein